MNEESKEVKHMPLNDITKLINKLAAEHNLDEQELLQLLQSSNEASDSLLSELARKQAQQIFGRNVYLRGLIEFSNYCRNDCLYCGIRRSNSQASRYRLTPEQILDCCEEGYDLGLRTFVLQGGEDFAYNDQKLTKVIENIKKQHPDCAVTISAGERPPHIYRQWFEAGADRYLLRHETATAEHYAKLHPPELTLQPRLECLYNLKEIGYQVGTGFMVGSPWQTTENLVQDLLFIKKFQPHMVGIGPFIPHHDTPLAAFPAGSITLTLKLLAILRLLLPNLLLPATTALNTLSEKGHQLGILTGANVIMPNLSPQDVRAKYTLYDNKRSTGSEAAEGIAILKAQLAEIGYSVPVSRGDAPGVKL